MRFSLLPFILSLLALVQIPAAALAKDSYPPEVQAILDRTERLMVQLDSPSCMKVLPELKRVLRSSVPEDQAVAARITSIAFDGKDTWFGCVTDQQDIDLMRAYLLEIAMGPAPETMLGRRTLKQLFGAAWAERLAEAGNLRRTDHLRAHPSRLGAPRKICPF